MPIWMRHPDHGVLDVYSESDVERNKLAGWEVFDRFAQEPVQEPTPESVHEEDRASLMAQCEARGIKINRRWGVKMLRLALDRGA